jgi:glycosyl transferase, family 25
MKLQLDNLRIEHEFFHAIDGRKLTDDQMAKMCNMEVVKAWPDLLTPGMIGCSLSHYEVYKKMVNEGIELAFILEDDTRLSKELPEVLSQIEFKFQEDHLNPNEPLLLYYQSKEPVTFSTYNAITLSSKASAYYPIELWRPITTAAYVISLSCAKRLVDLIYPIRYSPDSWSVYHREGAIGGLRCVLPLPVESGFFKSDIGYEENKKLNSVIKSLESKNIFPIPQLLKKRRRVRAKKQNLFIIEDGLPQWEIKSIS